MPSIDIRRYEQKKQAKPATVAESGGLMAVLNKDISFGSKELPDKKKGILIP